MSKTESNLIPKKKLALGFYSKVINENFEIFGIPLEIRKNFTALNVRNDLDLEFI